MCTPVFPACAGMFLASLRKPTPPASFPRVRGDVPLGAFKDAAVNKFSPRARGCSVLVTLSFSEDKVFPACAGMFPREVFIGLRSLGFPRVRGDVPFYGLHETKKGTFSPRARGCSAQLFQGDPGTGVFPACAGMFRILRPCYRPWRRFPRVRGDVPRVGSKPRCSNKFSPRARGCSCVLL